MAKAKSKTTPNIEAAAARPKRKFKVEIPPEQKVEKVPEGVKKKLRPKSWKEVKEGIALPLYPGEKNKVDKKAKYPPPSEHPTFIARWNDVVGELSTREGFQPYHLANLRVWCQLYVEEEQLANYVDKNGYSYEVDEGRNGPQVKYWPEVNQLNRTRSEIRNYTRLLGLLPPKSMGEGPEEPDNEWS